MNTRCWHRYMCKVQLCPGAGDENRHPEADAERQGREHQEVAGDEEQQGIIYDDVDVRD